SSATDFLRDAVIEGRATAVITYDHHIATTLVGAAPPLGLRIPERFSLICFNDVFPIALLPPPLTAVAVSGREMGRIGADLLLNSLLTPSNKPAKEIRVAEDLIVRASTAPPPASLPTSRRGDRSGHAAATSTPRSGGGCDATNTAKT